MNTQDYVREPFTLIDEKSETEFFIGVSVEFKDKSKPMWRIKRIWKTGNIWNFGFPDGNQDYKFIWNNRETYNYM